MSNDCALYFFRALHVGEVKLELASRLEGVGARPEIDEATEIGGLDDEHRGVGVDDVLVLHGVEIEDGLPGHGGMSFIEEILFC